YPHHRQELRPQTVRLNRLRLRHRHQLLLKRRYLRLHDAPRHLHSFPTRRSSDLLDWKEGSNAVPAELGQTGAFVDDKYAKKHHRSEEHTSELQSLAYLVCRLLPEKKKQSSRSPRPTTPAARAIRATPTT